MSDPRHELGLEGEQLAERFLSERGLKTVARRFATPVGELDLVMRDGAQVVFVEVKTRHDRIWADPADSVHVHKQRRLARAARWFLHHRGWEEHPCRFDVVTITLAPGPQPALEHIPDFFTPPDR